jgi:hypothetical protein
MNSVKYLNVSEKRDSTAAFKQTRKLTMTAAHRIFLFFLPTERKLRINLNVSVAIIFK